MDPDLVVQRLVAGAWLVGGALLVAVLAVYLAGLVCRRAGLGNGLGCGQPFT